MRLAAEFNSSFGYLVRASVKAESAHGGVGLPSGDPQGQTPKRANGQEVPPDRVDEVGLEEKRSKNPPPSSKRRRRKEVNRSLRRRRTRGPQIHL